MAKNTVLSEDDIIVRVSQKSHEAVGWYDSKISKERMRVLEYYNGAAPRRQHSGSSSYVSTDVYDGVEMLKAQLLEVFGGGDDIAVFDPDQDMTIADCKAATAYARYVIFQQNDGFRLFNDVIHDGLTARIGVVKVYWDEDFEDSDEEFDNLSPQEAMALAVQEDVEDFEAEIDEDTGMAKGKFIRKVDRSQVRIEVMAPEEVLVEPRAITFRRAGYVAHRTLKTKAELIKMGLDKKKVEKVHYDDARGLDLSPEVLARNSQVETFQSMNNPIQPELEQVMLYEEYVRMVIDKSKGARLYKVLRADSVLFEYQEVDCVPFIAYVPLPIPHLAYGNNFAARVIPYQNAQTVLTRAVLDHASISTNPRWAVVKGGLSNPREMLDNRLGGIVNVTRPDSVAALQVPNLNPFVFEIIQKLEQNKEQSTGISALSQGLNKDAISKQNSAGLVDNLVQLASQRSKIAARFFAYGFLVPLMLEVMRLVCMHEKKQKIITVAGQPIRITPEMWTERTACTVSMHLGYGERDQALAKYEKLYQGAAQDPVLGQGFGYAQRYAMINEAAKLGGINMTPFLLTPDKVQPPKPDPLKTAEVQAKTTSANAQMLLAQSAAEKDKRLEAFDAAKIAQQQTDQAVKAADLQHTHARQDAEVASRISIAEREMQLEERMRPQELKGIVSPNA